MRCSRNALAVTLVVGSVLSIASTGNGTAAATGLNTALDRPTAVDQAQHRHGGHRPPAHYCWYRGASKSGPNRWHGPGWYWCGYRLRHGARNTAVDATLSVKRRTP
jgi:hypothetical protein